MTIAEFIRESVLRPRLKQAGALVVYDADKRYRELCFEVEQRRQARPAGIHRTGHLVGEHVAGFNTLRGQRRELYIEVLTKSAHPRVPENRRHALTVSSTSDIEDLRHAL